MGEAASNIGRSGTVLSSSGPKVLDETSPVLETFKARYCDNANALDLNLSLVERILNQRCTMIADEEEAESSDENARKGKLEAPSKLSAPGRPKAARNKTEQEDQNLPTSHPLAFPKDKRLVSSCPAIRPQALHRSRIAGTSL